MHADRSILEKLEGKLWHRDALRDREKAKHYIETSEEHKKRTTIKAVPSNPRARPHA